VALRDSMRDRVQAGNENLRVHRRFYKDTETADRALAQV